VAKPELGTKRLCASCGAKFYDLNKVPIHCPKCETVYEIVVATRPVRPAGPATARPPVPEEAPAPEPQEVETVSLEEADAEAQGAAKKPAPAEAGIEEEGVEMDESLDDDKRTSVYSQNRDRDEQRVSMSAFPPKVAAVVADRGVCFGPRSRHSPKCRTRKRKTASRRSL
jgi:uncharacterized protein (TIGR02300 family)